jgi:hypothetical protein
MLGSEGRDDSAVQENSKTMRRSFAATSGFLFEQPVDVFVLVICEPLSGRRPGIICILWHVEPWQGQLPEGSVQSERICEPAEAGGIYKRVTPVDFDSVSIEAPGSLD